MARKSANSRSLKVQMHLIGYLGDYSLALELKIGKVLLGAIPSLAIASLYIVNARFHFPEAVMLSSVFVGKSAVFIL